MSKEKKIILIYPYFNGISGAYNRYLLLEKLIKRENFKSKLILFKDKKSSSNFTKIIYKFLRFLKVEVLIIFYSFFKNYYLITDFNPSITALFSKNVFIQIHDVSWVNRNFIRHNLFSYRVFKFFIKYYQNILTVSKTSMLAIKKVSGRKKRISYLYNSVNEDYINQSNCIGKDRNVIENSIISKSINLNLPNLIYIASLTPRKCHLDLIEALLKTNILFNLNLVGLPTDKKILDFIKSKKALFGKSIKSKINYYPKLSQKDLCYLLLYSSAYISTSMDEGFGIPLLEASLYDIPLIIRDIEVNRELFPKAIFFKSSFQLTKLLNNLKPLSKVDINERKKIISNLNSENIPSLFNYSFLSKELRANILN